MNDPFPFLPASGVNAATIRLLQSAYRIGKMRNHKENRERQFRNTVKARRKKNKAARKARKK